LVPGGTGVVLGGGGVFPPPAGHGFILGLTHSLSDGHQDSPLPVQQPSAVLTPQVSTTEIPGRITAVWRIITTALTTAIKVSKPNNNFREAMELM
jgi:hypothetical protein